MAKPPSMAAIQAKRRLAETAERADAQHARAEPVTSPPDDVKTQSPDDVDAQVRSDVAPQSGDAVSAPMPASVATSKRDDVITQERDDANERLPVPASEDEDRPRPRARAPKAGKATDAKKPPTKPHTSVYMSNAALRELRIIAATEGVSHQDLFREALRDLFKRRGRDFDRLDSKL